MAEFIARRIHEGYMAWEDLSGKKKTFVKAVKAAYQNLYPEEKIPT